MSIQQIFQKNRWVTVSMVLLLVALGPCAGQADQLIEDDLIVEGSECLGNDCVLDEDFGFSTLLLKENNVSIFFNDTSSLAGFPANDWEIIANDVGNGGASFLGFADRLVGYPHFGNAGLCVGGLAAGNECIVDTECAGICNGGTFNGNPCSISDSTCADFGGICEDAGMCVTEGNIIFLIEAGAPANSLKIDSSGFVGLGTDAPAAELDVNGDAIVRGNLTVSGTIGGGTDQMCPARESVVGITANGTIICAIVEKPEIISCDGFESCPSQ